MGYASVGYWTTRRYANSQIAMAIRELSSYPSVRICNYSCTKDPLSVHGSKIFRICRGLHICVRVRVRNVIWLNLKVELAAGTGVLMDSVPVTRHRYTRQRSFYAWFTDRERNRNLGSSARPWELSHSLTCEFNVHFRCLTQKFVIQ